MLIRTKKLLKVTKEPQSSSGRLRLFTLRRPSAKVPIRLATRLGDAELPCRTRRRPVCPPLARPARPTKICLVAMDTCINAANTRPVPPGRLRPLPPVSPNGDPAAPQKLVVLPRRPRTSGPPQLALAPFLGVDRQKDATHSLGLMLLEAIL